MDAIEGPKVPRRGPGDCPRDFKCVFLACTVHGLDHIPAEHHPPLTAAAETNAENGMSIDSGKEGLEWFNRIPADLPVPPVPRKRSGTQPKIPRRHGASWWLCSAPLWGTVHTEPTAAAHTADEHTHPSDRLRARTPPGHSFLHPLDCVSHSTVRPHSCHSSDNYRCCCGEWCG